MTILPRRAGLFFERVRFGAGWSYETRCVVSKVRRWLGNWLRVMGSSLPKCVGCISFGWHWATRRYGIWARGAIPWPRESARRFADGHWIGTDCRSEFLV